MMEKGVVVYRSKYGASRKYAGWIGERMGFDCVGVSGAAMGEVERYGTVVFCGGIYASGIAGLSFLRRNFERLRGRRLAVFCVGASPYDEGALEEVRARNLTGDLRGIPLFYGRGVWDLEKMRFLDRVLCRMLMKSVAGKDPAACEPWMRELICLGGESCDWTDRRYLEPLWEYLEGGGKRGDCV